MDKESIRKEYNPFIEFIKDRIKKNRNCIIVIVGGTGSGKSWAALRLAETLDPNFTIDNLCFRAIDFVKLINKDVPPGSVLMFDEGGVDLGSREFMSKKNRRLSKILQTVRYKNHIIIITVPDMSFLDAHARKLTHVVLSTMSINKRKGLNKLIPYIISTASMTGEIYTPHPRVMVPKQGLIAIRNIYVKMPSIKLRHNYERVKTAFADNLYAETLKELVASRGTKTLTDVERGVWLAYKFGVPDAKAAEVLGVKIKTITRQRTDLRRQGYMIPLQKTGRKKVVANDGGGQGLNRKIGSIETK